MDAETPVDVPEAPRAPPLAIAKDSFIQDQQTVREWLDGLASGEAPMRVDLIRQYPKRTPDGVIVQGKIDEFDEPVSEEDVQERHGGGKYQLRVSIANKNGSMVFAKARTIMIPGEPKYSSVIAMKDVAPAASPRSEPSSLSEKALQMTRDLADGAQRRAEKVEEENRELRRAPAASLDPVLIDLIKSPLLAQLKAEQDRNASLERRLEKVETTKPDNTFQEKMLLSATDGAEQRLAAIRTAHDAELRTLRANHDQDMKRLEDRHEKTLDRLEESHKREMATLTRSMESQGKSTEQAMTMRLESKDSEIKKLERELAAKDTELARLRALKEKGPLDAMKDAVELKATMVEMGLVKDDGDDDDDEDGGMPGWVKGIVGVLDSPVAHSVADRISGTPAPAKKTQEQQYAEWAASLPVGKPVNAGGGQIVIKLPNGQVVDYAKLQMARTRAAAKAKRTGAPPAAEGGAPAATPAPAAEPPLRMAKEDLAKAVTFIEGAIVNGTAPADFVASAVTLAPKSVMKALKKQTVEWFLDQVDVNEASPIYTQAGREWLRQVAAILKGGSK